ncbi:MAG: esterase family protein [Selenomonadaceae bacterium]|nr:esterase family protein [Selenomonadaceae bacterium]
MENICWYSGNLQRDMNVKIYGGGGLPLLIFPTQDAMSDNFENFGMIYTLKNFIDANKIQLFCVDTVDSESWSNIFGDKVWRAARQESYYNYIIEEVLPLIRNKNSSKKLPIAIGCSLGALHAAIVFLRRPELFGGMLAMSGVYDTKFLFDGWLNPTLYDNSPIEFLSNMPANHPYIEIYNTKKIIFCIGQGRWEEEGLRTTAILKNIFAEKKINAWTDFWGYDVDHDWVWWKKQIVYFLPKFFEEEV